MICDRVAILVGGRVARQGALHDLTATDQRYEIEIHAPPHHTDIARQAITKLFTAPPTTSAGSAAVTSGTLPSGVRIEISSTIIRAATTNPLDIQPLLDTLRAGNIAIKRVQSIRPSLEELFMQAVTDPATGKTMALGAAANPPPLPK